MNSDYIANILFNIIDTIETLGKHPINDEIIDQYDESQFDGEKPETLLDIPKDGDGTAITIGNCLSDARTHLNELEIFFAKFDKEIDSHD